MQAKREDIRVTGWTDWQFREETGVGIPEVPDDMRDAAETTIIEEIKKRGYKFSGSMHQQLEYCVPVINDQYCYQCSTRTWGWIMAEAFLNIGDPKKDRWKYLNWAWMVPEGETAVVPGDHNELYLDKGKGYWRYREEKEGKT